MTTFAEFLLKQAACCQRLLERAAQAAYNERNKEPTLTFQEYLHQQAACCQRPLQLVPIVNAFSMSVQLTMLPIIKARVETPQETPHHKRLLVKRDSWHLETPCNKRLLARAFWRSLPRLPVSWAKVRPTQPLGPGLNGHHNRYLCPDGWYFGWYFPGQLHDWPRHRRQRETAATTTEPTTMAPSTWPLQPIQQVPLFLPDGVDSVVPPLGIDLRKPGDETPIVTAGGPPKQLYSQGMRRRL